MAVRGEGGYWQLQARWSAAPDVPTRMSGDLMTQFATAYAAVANRVQARPLVAGVA